jgi:hypothetical protein
VVVECFEGGKLLLDRLQTWEEERNVMSFRGVPDDGAGAALPDTHAEGPRSMLTSL